MRRVLKDLAIAKATFQARTLELILNEKPVDARQWCMACESPSPIGIDLSYGWHCIKCGQFNTGSGLPPRHPATNIGE